MLTQDLQFTHTSWRGAVHRHLVAYRLLPLLLAAVGCAQPGAPMPGPAPAASSPVRAEVPLVAPQQIGAFTLTDTRRFPDASAGVRYRYAAAGALRPDVFVYPAAPNVQQPGVRDTLAYESDKFKEALAVMQQRGTYASFRILSDSQVEAGTPGGRVRGRRVSATLTQNGERLDSHQFLFLLWGQFVKVRATYKTGEVTSQELTDFLNGLVTALAAERTS